MIKSRTIIESVSCDLCKDELNPASVEGEDFINIRIGKPEIILKQLCGKCRDAFVTAINAQG